VKDPIHQVAIITNPLAEDAVSALLEREFGQTPSVYTDATTQLSTVSVYWHFQPGERTELRTTLRDALNELEEDGVEIAPARIKVIKVPPQDWSESWKKHFKPLAFGDALLVKPTWSKRKPSKGQQVVLLDPGLSFGTGQHATTRFCLGEIVRGVNGGGRSFLDIGTGSGILAIAAAKLGYSPVEAFDFDPDCVRISLENAVLNKVESSADIHAGDVTKLPLKATARFNLVCANLIYDLLIAQSAKITARVAEGGSLVLAGILETQFKQVQTAYEARGWKLVRARTEKEWRSGIFQR
jgi:ribosomal protein L11 methyltransferase